MKKTLLLTIGWLWIIAVSVGIVFPNFYESLFRRFQFGAVSYPTSLDSFSNPGATDSVATVVTHSTHHGNANDAIEALEAKLGIGATTPVSGTLLGSTGTGVSGWFAWATTTRLTSTNFLATGSTTLQNFTFNNATGTSATTTSFFATTASSTNLFGENINGFSLSTCESTNALTWSGGRFGCLAISSGGPTVFATTTAGSLATTTFSIAAGSLPNTSVWKITFIAASTTGSLANTADVIMMFNNDNSTNYSQISTENWGAPDAPGAASYFTLLGEDLLAPQHFYQIDVTNSSNIIKSMEWSGVRSASTTSSFGASKQGYGIWKTQTPITRIDIALNSPFAQFATGTVIEIIGY